MARAKSLVENLCDKRGNSSYAREHKMCESLHVYSESFNRKKAESWFMSIPPMITFRGNFTFNIDGFGENIHFAPSTMADFIGIVQSLGHELEVSIMAEEDEIDAMHNSLVRKLIQ